MMEIDDSLYSRQRYVLGDNAMKQLASSNVLIYGMGGVGIETAKNVALAGVKSLTVVDDRVCQEKDLSTQFYISRQDIRENKTRAQASAAKLSELNPYVTISCGNIDLRSDVKALADFQCVVITEEDLQTQITINKFCRSQQPPIKFISADVIGLCGRLFCDFGDDFTVFDSDGEEPKEIFIENIESGIKTTIECFEYRRHGLEAGDCVQFSEINGMTELNGTTHLVHVMSPDSFSINVDSRTFSKYLHGGVSRQRKQERLIHFKSLETQCHKPDILSVDFSQLDLPTTLHVAYLALQDNRTLRNCDDVSCSDEFVSACKTVAKEMNIQSNMLNEEALSICFHSRKGQFAPLCAVIGSIAAQEVLKAVTGKFMPLDQFLYIDAFDVWDLEAVLNSPQENNKHFLGERTALLLKKAKLFMVGCGAIGCEMLKNFALLGIATDSDGLITITDNDLIEKSNLNRQFLFRPQHIQKSKSLVACDVVKGINPGLSTKPLQHKVCPETEKEIFTDEFFQSQTIVVNALDNLPARRYVDSRCVSNKRPLLETGTMGAKGHVQVIVPYLTESYSAQRDPVDTEFPYCTLKSFPQVIEHTIQWARDKFESCYSQKPAMFNKFWATHKSPKELYECDSDSEPDDFAVAVGMIRNRPLTWRDCVTMARIKFEKYFNHMAKQLLYAFPMDTILADGSLFWQSPKRPPKPVVFDDNNELHILFVKSRAALSAAVYGIKPSQEDFDPSLLKEILSTVKVPQFVPSSKVIETDESAKEESKMKDMDSSKVELCREFLERLVNDSSLLSSLGKLELHPEVFEKDDDSNSHIDFITATSNLRAEMYGIEKVDRYVTKRIAGKIIPAIATTTAAIAGLACIELVKMICKSQQQQFKNAFLNLALPLVVLSEPAPPTKTAISESLGYTIWDRWDVQGNADFLLSNFITHFQDKHGLTVSMVVHGVKMIYVPAMPGHTKRRNDKMTKLLKPDVKTKYFDLTVAFDNPNDPDDDLSCPPVRYHF